MLRSRRWQISEIVGVMVDSSAWIEYFRCGEGDVSDVVDGLLEEERVWLCSVVEAEIVRGIRLTEGLRTRELVEVADIFVSAPYIDVWDEDCEAANKRMKDLRSRGITIPTADCLIGILCIRYNLALLTLDKHFDHMPEVERILTRANNENGE